MTKDDKRGSVGQTPGLWRVQPIDRDFAVIASVDGITWQIAEVYDTGPNEESTAKANAAHIVLAVNSYDDLVSALRLIASGDYSAGEQQNIATNTLNRLALPLKTEGDGK